MAIFLLNQTLATIYIWFILYGIGMGLGNTVNLLMRARYFGRKAFGSIAGVSRMIMTPIGIVAPIYVGWVYDTSGSYIPAFTLFAALLTLFTVLLSFARPPKPPARVTDIRRITG